MKKIFIFLIMIFGVKTFACGGCACIPGCGLCEEVYLTYIPNMNEVYADFELQDRQTGAFWSALFKIRKENETLEKNYETEIKRINVLNQQINLTDREADFLLKKIQKLEALKLTKEKK